MAAPATWTDTDVANVLRVALDAWQSGCSPEPWHSAATAFLAEIRQAEADAKSEVLPGPDKTQGGRPLKDGVPRREITERTGFSRQGQERIEKHVALAEQRARLQQETRKETRKLGRKAVA